MTERVSPTVELYRDLWEGLGLFYFFILLSFFGSLSRSFILQLLQDVLIDVILTQ